MDDDEVPSDDSELIGRLRARKTEFALLFEPTVREYEILGEDGTGSSGESIEPLAKPQDVSTMPLFSVVDQIAGRDGARDFGGRDGEAWKSATDALRDRISAGDLPVSGRRSARHLAEIVPSEAFRGVTIAHPYQEGDDFTATILHDEPVLELRGSSCAEGHGGDQLFDGARKLAWRDLRVSGRDVARIWPLGAPSTDTAPHTAPLARKVLLAKRAAVMEALKKAGFKSKEEIRLRGYERVAGELIAARHIEEHYRAANVRSGYNLAKMLKVTTDDQF